MMATATNNRVLTTTFDVVRGEFPTDTSAFDGYIITGSKHSVYDQNQNHWLQPLFKFTAKLDSEKRKLLGICFGHQVVAEALGGKVEQVGWNLSHEVIQATTATATVPATEMTTATTSSELLKQLQQVNNKLELLCVHRDQVTLVPPGFEVWCSNSACKVQGLYKNNHILTIQAHPEFSAELMRELLEYKRSVIQPEKLVDEALQRVDLPTNALWVAKWIVNFFTKV